MWHCNELYNFLSNCGFKEIDLFENNMWYVHPKYIKYWELKSKMLNRQHFNISYKSNSNLTFKKHIRKVSQRVRFSLANFKYIRNTMTFNAAKLYVNAMVMSHLTYCLTSWGHTNASTLKPLETLYKQTLKVLDQKPNSSYYCTILHKHKLLSWEDVIKHRNICLLFKILHGFAPPPLNSLINQRSTFQINRSTTRGDLSIPQKKSTFGQLSFSFKAIPNWNSLPTHIKDTHTYSTPGTTAGY